eukprot:TRINITY_DN71386_c0_g1_i1.p1 TRINITY_DN71386_c0_g1~~TRINITY_DN71386_c0_g1_i1.p1  ORF type:complete len:959 (-),score=180.30 TRINITY_DN71386_c0_g1_i1:83-2959(-)
MVACCGKGKDKEDASKDDKEKTRKFEKGGDRDISQGPLKERRCTDILCLLFWLCSVVVYLVVTFVGVRDGDAWKLVAPRDYKGDYCGRAYQWNGGQDMTGYDNLIYLMNVTSTVDLIAKQMVCSSAAEDALASIMSEQELSDYRCACCKTACKACQGSLTMKDIQNPDELSSLITERMAELTDPEKVKSLFSGGGANGDLFSSMWAEVTKFFVTVCTTDCDVIYQNTTRTYRFTPAPDATWKKAWDVLASHKSVPTKLRNVIENDFTFGALPRTVCPYSEKYCVPFPGIVYRQVKSVCMFELQADILGDGVGETATTAMQATQAAMEGASEDFGDLVGDFMVTIDCFFVTAIFAFVVGLVFLILLRFIVGIVVWGSLAGVLALFVVGGFMLALKSGQCKGISLSQTGQAVGMSAAKAAASKAADAVKGSNNAKSEKTTAPFQEDYRGGQTRTLTNRLCQRWDSQGQPHNHTTTPENFPDAGLEQNFCRNPNGTATSIWCYTTEPEKRWEQCSPMRIGLQACPAGYEVDSASTRYWLMNSAYVLWVLAGIWILLVFCMQKRIRLAVALNKVAATFIIQTPSIVAVPLVQVFCGMAWTVLWGVSVSFLLTQVPASYTPMESFATYAEAYGTEDTPGKCTDKWPTGFVWKSEGDLNATNDTCSGYLGDISVLPDGPKCWRCAPPRYVIDARVWTSLFCYLWNNALLIAIGQCVIACAVGIWFFTPMKEKGRGRSPVIRAVKTVFRYHLGSLAFGAFILAVVQFIRYVMKYLEKNAKAQKNKVMVLVLKVVQCLLWCFEKCIKFLNKNAYIQIALLGTNFCTSAKAAFYLIFRNMLRFGTVAILGSIIQFIGVVFIMSSTTAVGYVVLTLIHPSAAPIVPILSYITLGWLSAKLYMNVFGLVVDTALQCFIIVEEMDDEASLDFVPKALKKLCPKKKEEPKEAWAGDKKKDSTDAKDKEEKK